MAGTIMSLSVKWSNVHNLHNLWSAYPQTSKIQNLPSEVQSVGRHNTLRSDSKLGYPWSICDYTNRQWWDLICDNRSSLAEIDLDIKVDVKWPKQRWLDMLDIELKGCSPHPEQAYGQPHYWTKTKDRFVSFWFFISRRQKYITLKDLIWENSI